MKFITSQQLQDIFLLPASDRAVRADAWIAPLNAGIAAGAIGTPVRQAAFLAQVLVESSEFQHVQEALNYTPQRLVAEWPKHFPSTASAEPYSHHPQKLADMVYADRMGNGDAASGDGWKYRGRGLIQLTGRSNYSLFSHANDIDAIANPDLLIQPAGAVLSAAWFWNSRNLNVLADLASEASLVKITALINGGNSGLDRRRTYWKRAQQVLA